MKCGNLTWIQISKLLDPVVRAERELVYVAQVQCFGNPRSREFRFLSFSVIDTKGCAYSDASMDWPGRPGYREPVEKDTWKKLGEVVHNGANPGSWCSEIRTILPSWYVKIEKIAVACKLLIWTRKFGSIVWLSYRFHYVYVFPYCTG